MEGRDERREKRERDERREKRGERREYLVFVHETRITVDVGRVRIPQNNPLSSLSSYLKIHLALFKKKIKNKKIIWDTVSTKSLLVHSW